MKWSYKVIKHETKVPGNPKLESVAKKSYPFWYGLHSCYYDDEGRLASWSAEPTEAAESVEELRDILKMQYRAAEKALVSGVVLDEAQIEKEVKQNGKSKISE